MRRKKFLETGSAALLGSLFLNEPIRKASLYFSPTDSSSMTAGSLETEELTLFLSGDVMTGRGIDQILPYSVSPELNERYVNDARRYVELAENKHGSIPEEVSYDYIWGDALNVLSDYNPDARIINLETSVTDSDEYWPGKGIHYRMHPKNTALFAKAAIDICILGNNHILDFGYPGLHETLESLQEAGIKTAGAGNNSEEATKPAVMNTKSGRLLVFSYGSPTAGVPRTWGAEKNEQGVNLLPELSEQSVKQVTNTISKYREQGDRVVISIHWGSNWGYQIPEEQQKFARRLIDAGAADIIHGHSSHHPKGIEVYKNRPIIYGAGDLINDYEGISGRPQYRDDLSLMYFPGMKPSGKLHSLKMRPMHIRQFQLQHATKNETEWLKETLDRECKKLGSSVSENVNNELVLNWD